MTSTVENQKAEWLDKVSMGLVMITLKNAPDKEYLNYKGYTFYQDDWEMCAGWVKNREGEIIASWNMYRNAFTGTEEDKAVIMELWGKTSEQYDYKLSDYTPKLHKQPEVKEISSNSNDMRPVFVAVGILVILFLCVITTIMR